MWKGCAHWTVLRLTVHWWDVTQLCEHKPVYFTDHTAIIRLQQNLCQTHNTNPQNCFCLFWSNLRKQKSLSILACLLIVVVRSAVQYLLHTKQFCVWKYGKGKMFRTYLDLDLERGAILCFLNDCILWQICLQNWQKNNISGINFSEKCLGSDWVLRNSLWRGIPTYMRPVVPLWKNSLVNNKDKLQYKVLSGIGLDRWRGYAKSNIVNVVILFKQLWKIKSVKN